MVTITLMGQLQSAEGERDLLCELAGSMTVRQVIQRQGDNLREILGLMREKKLMITVNKKIASEDTPVHDGDTIKLVPHDGMSVTGLGPSF